jgi:hypothetical protein
MFAEIKFFRFHVFVALLAFGSCSKQDPEGTYEGSIKDWVEEVFEGTLIADGKTNRLQVILKQTPDGLLAEMKFSPPGKKDVLRSGKWEVGDGERVLRFSDGNEPSEFFLIKRGARFAFQTKQGITNDDGSLVLLMRNEGLSRKTAYRLRITFEGDGKATVNGGGVAKDLPGEWKWSSGDIVVKVTLPPEEGSKGTTEQPEDYKYYLNWAEDSPDELELEKMLILRPFFNADGSKRQSWMSSLKFKERPRLKQN